MPQLSLYLDNGTMEKLRRDASREGISLSRHAAHLIRLDGASRWPTGFLDLNGSVKDDSFAEPSELDWSLDARRPAL